MDKKKSIISTPYSFNVGPISIGNSLPFILIAGPCMLESEDLALEIAHKLTAITTHLNIPFIFKASFDKANRTSIFSKRGISLEKSLEIFEKIKKTYNCPVLTDVHEPSQCEEIAQVVDVLQIPSLLCRQTDIVTAAAKTKKALNIKKGQFLSPQEMYHVALKAHENGNDKVILCERGTCFGYNNLVNDMRALPIMQSTGYPVIFDTTHSVQKPGALTDKTGGESWFIETLARAAISTNIAGIFAETHPNPDKALSDGPNMIPLDHMEGFLHALKILDETTKKLPYQKFSYQAF